ncbi:twin-arginine translocation signal domain-containing protein [Palleronia caenipelagi]|uniref:Twin-arginine translocation signal domain-containing protein n=1 Tax=Palleronia caenipelagi TaxID=2489174 RepID=A0A547Q9F3_9RHOB|nr:twin-arginine translocation signal domain-containing protein [Palleronia caenipelagi]TRD23016.1 twin-arginine translocation signal domain-containing protein [Palleronia caenipelagi]
MTEKDSTNRRNFLKLAGSAAPAAALVAATAGTEAEASETETDHYNARLQDTAQTRAYYKAARF